MADIAALIENSGAIKHGKFKLTDGVLTDYYIDKYAFETQPNLLSVLVQEIASLISNDDIAVVAGPVLGAVPLVTAVSLNTGINGAFIRTAEKHQGTQARIEGSIGKGQSVVVLEDVTTTGSTILQTANIIEEVGGLPERFIAVVDRNEGAVARLRQEGYELEFLVQVGEDLDIETSAD